MLAQGVSNLDKLQELTDAGTGCGECVPYIEDMMQKMSGVSSPLLRVIKSQASEIARNELSRFE